MHFARARKRLTAWFGLAAMVLALFAPAVSQALASHAPRTSFEQAVPLCEAKPTGATGIHQPAGHGMPADHHAACGYCNFLAQHVLAPAPIAPMAMLAPNRATPWTAAPERLAVRETRHAGRPRDSPFLA